MEEQNVNYLPLIGDQFPEMRVMTTQGAKDLPGSFKGNWFVLFSHPGDFTPVCTTEFVSFARHVDEFEAMNTKLIGLSIDQVFAHIKWEEWIEENMETPVPFPIIADAAGEVSQQLGMVHPNKGNSTVRAVFIVDDKGVIRLILYYPQEIGRNINEIIRSVKALQISDKEGVALPANWPENEIIGDKVIIPPATDVKTAKERKDKYECYDWWFCYKNLKK
jgi:peroxiredoxin (alkyl hydroperoxide reductase subunit C)